MQRQTGIAGVLGLMLALWTGVGWAQFDATKNSGTNTIRSVLNDPTTGTTTYSLAKSTATGALKATASETDKPLYIVAGGGGTTGYALFNLSGIVKCTMDATASNVAGHLVVASATPGRCHVFGPPTSPPASGYTVGSMHDNATTAGQEALVASEILNFTPGTGPGVGTVTSVAITPPAEYTVSGSPITGAGTIVWSKATQTANFAYRGPASGSAAAPGFRADVKADLPPQLAMTGNVTPTALSGDINDYSNCTTAVCRVNGGTADRNWTGLAAGLNGDIQVLRNVGTTNALVLRDESASSSAVNRFAFGGDITLFPRDVLTVIYDTTLSRWTALSTGIPDKYKLRPCAEAVGDVSVDAPPLLDDQDSPAACSNRYGKDWKILTVACRADAGAPTITPILTGAGPTSILTGPCTCGTGAWAACAVNGAPLVHPFSGTGATCSTTPCDIAINITTAGGTAKFLRVEFQGILQ